MGAKLDRIKNIFNKIFRGKEDTKLLISREETNTQKENFIRGISVDTEDLLNPELYQGDRLFSNVLMHVGVKKELAENPAVIREVLRHIEQWPVGDYYLASVIAHPRTKEEINTIIKLITESRIFEEEERKNIYYQNENTAFYNNNGIRINPDDGSITIQKFSGKQITNLEPNRNEIMFSVSTIEFSTDENGIAIKKEIHSSVDSHDKYLAKERVYSAEIAKYDLNGIEIAQHRTEYEYKPRDGKFMLEQFITYEAYSERDINNPFICKVDIKQNELYDKGNTYISEENRKQFSDFHCASKGVHYFPITPNCLEYLRLYESDDCTKIQNFEKINDTVKIPVFFDSLCEAQEYYEEHTKGKIEESIKCMNISDRFYKGKRILGEKAGLKIKEFER